jgi:cytochrome c oxidase subunit I+III
VTDSALNPGLAADDKPQHGDTKAAPPKVPARELLDQPVSDEEFGKVWDIPPGLWGRLITVQNSPLGMRFVGTALLFLALGGIISLLMRLQLARPSNTFLDPETYNRLFTMHGSTMMFLFSIPLIQGVTTLILPQMLGARELPFPRLSAFAYWTFLAGGLIFYASFLADAVPDTGWYAYAPLSGQQYSPGKGLDFWLLGLNVAEIGAIAGAIEIIITFFKVRGPGMTLNRTPIFAWAMLVTAFMMLFAFTPLIVGTTLLELDRKIATQFFNPAGGGDPLLWQHIFWIFGHPDVYIQFVPAVGIISMIVPTFTRRPLAGYPLLVVALIGTGFLSFGLWVHHMFATGLPELSLSFFSGASILIAIPAGVQIFTWIATIRGGRVQWKTPFLFTIGFFLVFVMGGLSGVMLAVAPFNLQITDTYFVVAHFHYVMIGGMLFPIFAAIYYWSPKYFHNGVMLSERLGKIHFWLLFIGFNVAFFPMHITGLLGMPRRVYTYSADRGWNVLNLISTIGSFIAAAGVAVFFWNLFISWRRAQKPHENPYGADSLEWATDTPVPQYGFRTLPIVRSRHPLWQQDNLTDGDEHAQRVVQTMARWPVHYRSQLATTALEAKPQHLFRIATDSIWPMVLALSLTALSVFLIYDVSVGSLISIVVSVIAVIGWHSDDNAKHVRDLEGERLFTERTGIPVFPGGSPSVSRWGIGLTIAALTTALITLVFCYFFLRINAPAWPPAGIALPQPALPAAAIVILLISLIPLRRAVTASRADDHATVRTTFGLTVLLGVIGIGLLLFSYSNLGFTHSTHAYGSVYMALAVTHGLIALWGLFMNAVTLFWTVRGDPEMGRYDTIANVGMFWTFAVIAGAVVAAVLNLLPYVL